MVTLNPLRSVSPYDTLSHELFVNDLFGSSSGVLVMSGKRNEIESKAVPLWPDAGRMLGLGRGTTYKKAQMGEIRTLPLSGKKLVPRSWLKQVLGE